MRTADEPEIPSALPIKDSNVVLFVSSDSDNTQLLYPVAYPGTRVA